ncbi:SAC3 family protein C-like isoform X1 [Coffea arabica]|uniref:SAC3 family protein C-like isoform X1 n=1 Tax=Coffea arabica TaxID=13443 RepID=A0ABM4WRB7_COFAR
MAERGQPFRQARGGVTRRNLPSSRSSFFTKSATRYQPPQNRNLNIRRNAQHMDSSFNSPNGNDRDNSDNRSWIKDAADVIDEENNLPSLVGTCPFMCPVEERLQRERLRDLATFERLDGNPGKSSSNLAVKKFCRTISTSELQVSDVRPLSVLEGTLNHLFNLFHSSEHPFEVVHDFIFDRTRSIRQDLSMQNISNNRAITMYERMVKFHIISHQKLHRSSSSPNVSSLLYLNLEQLTKSLMTLFNLYEANRISHSIYDNEPEFCSFYVLLQIHPDSKQGEPLSLWFCNLPSAIMKSKQMCFARNLLRYFRLGNYKRFMLMMKSEASYLQCCIVEPYINEVRALAVSCLNQAGYKLQPFPLADLSNLLLLQESDVESFCNECGLETSSDEVGKRILAPKQSSFFHPRKGFQKYYPIHSDGLQRVSINLLDL